MALSRLYLIRCMFLLCIVHFLDSSAYTSPLKRIYPKPLTLYLWNLLESFGIHCNISSYIANLANRCLSFRCMDVIISNIKGNLST